MNKNWSEILQQQTRTALQDCPATYDGFLHLKNCDGSFEKIAIVDVREGKPLVQWKDSSRDYLYTDAEDLMPAGLSAQ